MYMVERSLDTIIGYAATGEKSMKMRSDEARWKFANDVLLESVESELRKCAAVRRLGGPALSPHGFRKIRARARANDPSLKLDANDPDRQWKEYLPDVRVVCFCERCPKCSNCEEDSIRRIGYTLWGKQRFQCQKCKKSWSEKPVSSRKSGPFCGKRIRKKVAELRREGNSIRKIAAAINTSRYAVAKALSINR
jgi:transposase-like protein